MTFMEKTRPTSDALKTAYQAWSAGDLEAAQASLGEAVSAGEPGAARALFDLACEMGLGVESGADVRERIERAIGGMAEEASFRAALSASGLGAPADWANAIRLRQAAAAAGDRRAALEIALLTLAAGQADTAEAQLTGLAAAGSGEALAACLRLSIDRGWVSDAVAGAGANLARAGHPFGQALAAASRGLPVRPALQRPAPHQVNAGTLAAALETPPKAHETLSADPEIFTVPASVPAALCEYLAAAGVPLLQPARVFDPETGAQRPDPYRRSLTATLPPSALDLPLLFMKSRMAALAGVPVSQTEPLALLVYRPGEEYKPHFDFIVEDGGRASADLARRGQRAATVLLKLNDEHAGGATAFPRLGLEWRGRRAEALVFRNIDQAGERDARMLHAGTPVEEGVKLLASLWIRER